MLPRGQQARSVCALVAVLLLASVSIEGASGSGWITTPVGTATLTGAATTSASGRATVSGEGTDIWSTADGFQFLYQRFSGNLQIVAKLTSLENTDGWAKAGLMVRQALTANSPHASLLVTPANGIVFEQRVAVGGVTARSAVPPVAPPWLRLTRAGDWFRAEISSDGATWAAVGTQRVPMATDLYVGLAVTSRFPSKLTTATFERVAISVPTSTAMTLPAGPVAAWSFDDGVGTVARASIGGVDGVLSGARWTTAGKNAGALVFNGVNNVVTVSSNAVLNLSSGMTVEAWVYPTLLSSWRSVAVKEGSTDLAYGLYASDASAKPEGVINTGAGSLPTSGSATLPLNAWSHLATTFDGSTERLFVNGVQVSSAAASGTLKQTSGPLRIGGNSVWGEFFSGTLDNMRIYNRALSASEIQSDMATAVPPPPPDTTLPSITLTTPLNGVTVTGTVGVAAKASDNVGIASVQFLLNGANLGASDTAAPYAVSWSTQNVADGTYRLTALARDFAGNANISADVAVTVTNSSPVVSGGYVQFTSPDHFSTLPDGRAVVTSYSLEVWLAGSNTSTGQPYKTSSLGKPASSTTAITVDQRTFFGTLPKGQEFVTTVAATGPGGTARSTASNRFVMQ